MIAGGRSRSSSLQYHHINIRHDTCSSAEYRDAIATNTVVIGAVVTNEAVFVMIVNSDFNWTKKRSLSCSYTWPFMPLSIIARSKEIALGIMTISQYLREVQNTVDHDVASKSSHDWIFLGIILIF